MRFSKSLVLGLLAVMGLILTIGSVEQATETLAESSEPLPTAEVVRSEMTSQINAFRSQGRQCGAVYHPPAPAVSWHTLLEQSAQRHSQDMSLNDHFSHVGTDGSDFVQRISATGYRGAALGENIAYNVDSVPEVLSQWINSPPHCTSIMNAIYNEIGAARSGRYWTLDLARSAN